MPLEQRSQHCKPEEGLEARGEALGLVGAQAPATEEQETASSSSIVVEVTRGRCLLLSHRVLPRVLRTREPVTKAEMLESVMRNCQYFFPVIFSKASDSLQLVFGIELMEVDLIGHLYIFVTCLGLSYDGLLGDNQIMPKTGLLIIVLAIIAKEGDCAPEEKIWEELSVLEVFEGRQHSIFADPRKLLTQDFVQENYLEYQQVPSSDPACYKFLWGPRALVETSYVKGLYHMLKISRGPHFSYSPLHEWALREGEE
uniref:MAGE domain-containing protein n=1 Tax=Colobus angolensis palliatus TaxID=336983 RepID=A0A2K5I7K9_COLAP